MRKFVLILGLAIPFIPPVVWAGSLNDPVLVADTGLPMQDCVKADDADKTKCIKWGDYLVGTALARIVDQRYQGEDSMKLSEIVERGRLATKIRAAVVKDEDYKFSSKEIEMIKTLLPKAGQPARVTLQLCVVVDPDCS